MSAADGPHIIPRAEWDARKPRENGDKMPGPAQYVVIHHSAGESAEDPETCKKRVRSFQRHHINENKWDDIGYNFVVGEDGNVYEGRGWTVVGAHTRTYNKDAIGICVIGNYNSREPNSAALTTVQRLIQLGVTLGHIKASYTLKGHRDAGTTDCPGHCLYRLIQTWPRFAPKDKTYE